MSINTSTPPIPPPSSSATTTITLNTFNLLKKVNSKKENDLFNRININDYINEPKCIEFYDKALRFLILIETPSGSRSILFDSSTQHANLNANKLNEPQSPTYTNNNYKSFEKNSSNHTHKLSTNMLLSMVFGSMPMMVSSRNSMKVHSMKNENKIMISTVFNYYVNQNNNNKTLNETINIQSKTNTQNNSPLTSSTTLNDSNSLGRLSSSVSNPVPIKLKQTQTQIASSYASSSFNSNGSRSPTSSLPPNINGSYGPCGVYKRFMRSISNSLITNGSNHENTCDKKTSINHISHNDCEQIKFKIGIAIIYSITDNECPQSKENFFEFFFSHLPIIEYQIRELRFKLIKLLSPVIICMPKSSSINTNKQQDVSIHLIYNNQKFNEQVKLELDIYRSKFNSLYNSPRLSKPAWLTLINYKKNQINFESTSIDKHSMTTCTHLIDELCFMYKKLNNFKCKNLFFNTLISSILKYNLSWIYTVLPTELNSVSVNNLRKKKASWIQHLEKNNPYNPLWAQLGDLHGAVSEPLVLTKTVIIGDNKELVLRLLYVLSYFIRCSSNYYYNVIQDEFDFNKILDGTLTDEKNSNNREINVFELGSSPFEQQQQQQQLQTQTSPFKFTHHDLLCRLDTPLNNNDILSVCINDSNLKLTSTSNTSSSSCFSPSPISDNNEDCLFKVHLSPSHITTKKSPRLATTSTLSKHKFISSSSLSDSPNCNAQELPLIGYTLEKNLYKSTHLHDNFGYSLFGAYCDNFVFDYVLHGTSDRSFLNNLHDNLKFSKQNSILDCPIDETIYLIVDLDLLKVNVYSSEYKEPKIETNIDLIDSLLNSVISLNETLTNGDFVLLHLEDKLQELYVQSIALNNIKNQHKLLDKFVIMDILNIKENDYDFLERIINAISVPNLL